MRGIRKLNGIAILLAILIGMSTYSFAAGGNIDAELPSNDGTDAFQVKDNSAPDKKVLLHVNSTGKVGIGTTTPSALLTLSGGDIDIKEGRGLFLTDPGNTNSWGISTDASLNLVIGMGGIGEKLRLSSVGTLDISGYLHTQLSGGTSFWIQTPATDTRLFSEANVPLYIGTNGNAMMTTILPNGNVGVGTTTPTAKLDVAGDVIVQGQAYRSFVDFTPSGSGLKWIKMRYFGQNSAERPIHIYVTRAIGWNNSSPYGGPSLELTCLGNEWHWGQQFCTALYGYHGDPGAEITHAAIRNNAGNGYNVYLRLYGGVTYRIWTADDSGYIEGPVDDPTGAPVESAIYGLGHGLSIIGDAYNNLYVSGTANANTLCIQGDCKTAWPTVNGISWYAIPDKPAGFADNVDDVGIISESDPTVLSWVKDGISWYEIPDKPAGFADDVDNVGITAEDDPQVGGNTSNYIPKWNGSALVTGTIFDNGNVGIGTNNPQAKLEVESTSTVVSYAAVRGKLTTTGAQGRAIWGSVEPDGNTNVLGHAGYFDGQVYINCPSGTSPTNVGHCNSITGQPDKKYALYVEGNAYVNGTLAAQTKTFRIDHPLEPDNKYLNHASIESSDMKNLYDGIAILDESGDAWVELPNWFQALNKDFSYQLTCIGGFSPVYIAEEISNNRFKISGGQPGMKVSWQVTGIRHDTWAEANPMKVEVEK